MCCLFEHVPTQALEKAGQVIESVESEGRRDCVIVFLSDGQGSMSEGVLQGMLERRVERG